MCHKLSIFVDLYLKMHKINSRQINLRRVGVISVHFHKNDADEPYLFLILFLIYCGRFFFETIRFGMRQLRE